MELNVFSEIPCELGECPTYDLNQYEAYWTDIFGKRIYSQRLDRNETNIFDMETQIGAIGIREKGGLILASKEGFALVDNLGNFEPVKSFLGDGYRMNDGKCDAMGRFWAGSIEINFEKRKGKLHVLDSLYNTAILQTQLTLPNGMDWSPDNLFFYLVDSVDYILWQFDFDVDQGRIANKKVHYKFDLRNGIPDGLCVTNDGNLVVAKYGGSSLEVISAAGKLLDVFTLPVKNPTSCAFVGNNLDELLITTSIPRDAVQPNELDGKTLILKNFPYQGKQAYSFGG